MKPQDALSPRERIKPDTLTVIYTDPSGGWSLAEMVWDDKPRVGCRWNGNIDDPDDKGNPRSHSQGTWFLLPNEIGVPLATFVKTFREGYSGYNPMLFKEIDELELSVRTTNCLKNDDIVYIGDLVQKDEGEMLRIPNFGRQGLNEIKLFLAGVGLRLGMELPDWRPKNIEKLTEAAKRIRGET